MHLLVLFVGSCEMLLGRRGASEAGVTPSFMARPARRICRRSRRNPIDLSHARRKRSTSKERHPSNSFEQTFPENISQTHMIGNLTKPESAVVALSYEDDSPVTSSQPPTSLIAQDVAGRVERQVKTAYAARRVSIPLSQSY